MLRGCSSSPEGGSSAGSSASARQARSAELKNRRRITKALAAKRSRAQHGEYVTQLSQECDALRSRIRDLRLHRDVDAVAHLMVTEMAGAISGEQAATLKAWIKATSLENLVERAEARERQERAEREALEWAQRERERLDAEALAPPPKPVRSRSGKRKSERASRDEDEELGDHREPRTSGPSISSSDGSVSTLALAGAVSRLDSNGSGSGGSVGSANGYARPPPPHPSPYVGPYLEVAAPRLASLHASISASLHASPALGPAPTAAAAGGACGMLCLLEAAEGLADMAGERSAGRGASMLGAAQASGNGLRRMASDETAAALALAGAAVNGASANGGDYGPNGYAVKRDVTLEGRRARASTMEEEEEEEEIDSEEDEEDDGEEYCFCKTFRHLESNFRGVWVQCDECQVWCHGECAGLRSIAAAESVDHYVCPLCRGGDAAALAASMAAAVAKSRSRTSKASRSRPRGRPRSQARTAAAIAARHANAARAAEGGAPRPPLSEAAQARKASADARMRRFLEPRVGERGGLRTRDSSGAAPASENAAAEGDQELSSDDDEEESEEGEEEEMAEEEEAAEVEEAVKEAEEEAKQLKASEKEDSAPAAVEESGATRLARLYESAAENAKGEEQPRPASSKVKKEAAADGAAAEDEDAAAADAKEPAAAPKRSAPPKAKAAAPAAKPAAAKATTSAKEAHAESKPSEAGAAAKPPKSRSRGSTASNGVPSVAPTAATQPGSPAPRYSCGARVLVRFDDNVQYPGTVKARRTQEDGPPLYSVHFDDGDALDDVAEDEMTPAPRYAVGDRISVDFSGESYAGTGALHAHASANMHASSNIACKRPG